MNIKQMNQWYDKQKEPKRFYIMLGLVVPGIILTNIYFVGILYLIALLIIRYKYVKDIKKW